MGYVFLPHHIFFKRNERQDHFWPDNRYAPTVYEPEDTTWQYINDKWGQANVPMWDGHFAQIFTYHNDIRFFNGLEDWDFHLYLGKTGRLDYCKRSSFSKFVSDFFGLGFNSSRLAILEVVPFQHSPTHGSGPSYGYITPGLEVYSVPFLCQYVAHPGNGHPKFFDASMGVPYEMDVLGLEGDFPNIWEGLVFYTRAKVDGQWRHFVAASERFNLDTMGSLVETERYVPYSSPVQDDPMWKDWGGSYSGGYHGLVEGRTAYFQEVQITEGEQRVNVYTLEGQNSGKKLVFKLPFTPRQNTFIFHVGFKKYQGERRQFWRLTEDPKYPLSGVVGNDPHMPQNGEFLAETFSTETFNDFVFNQNSRDTDVHPLWYRFEPTPLYELDGYSISQNQGINPAILSDYGINPLSHYIVMAPDGFSKVKIRARHGFTPAHDRWAARKVEFFTGDKTDFTFDGPQASSWEGVPHLRQCQCNFRDYFREARECILDMIDQGCLTMAGPNYATTLKATTITSLHEYLDWKYNSGRLWGNISPDEGVPFNREISDPYAEEDPEAEEEEEEVGWAESLEEIGSAVEHQTFEWENSYGEMETYHRIISGPRDISFDELIPMNVNDSHIRIYFSPDCMVYRYVVSELRDVEDNVNVANWLVSSAISNLDSLLEGKEDVFIAAYFGEPWYGYHNYAKTTWNSGEIQDKIENFWGYQRPGPDPPDMNIFYWENTAPGGFLHDMINVRGLTINDEFTDEIPYSSYNGECYCVGITPISWIVPFGQGYGHWGIDNAYTDAYQEYYTDGYWSPFSRAKAGNIKLYCLYRYWSGHQSTLQSYCDETGGQLRTI